jgi:hypothetical protein
MDMRNWFPPAVLVAVVTGPLLSSCFFSPTGSNASPVLYPSPDGGHVQLRYYPPRTDVTKATFSIVDHTDVTIPPDDAADDENGITADIDVSKLTPGIYTVDVTLDDDADPTGHMTLLVPGVASGDGTASDTGTTDDTSSDSAASS